MKNICYNKNFITEAIAKVEFLNPILELDKTLPKYFSDSIVKMFPIAESREIKNNNVTITDSGVQSNVEKGIEWSFWNKDRSRKISLSKDSLLLVQNKYESYDNFAYEFLTAFEALCSAYKELIFRRFGVRYVNNIKLAESEPLNWSAYINDKLTASINIPDDSSHISRTFHNLEMNYENFNLKFNFGIHNPDYPAIIKQKVFILDIDAYHNGVQNKDDIISILPDFHNKIQELFEFSIKEELRKKLKSNGE
jgi:uncharacterized protein (TIGR04255 family)